MSNYINTAYTSLNDLNSIYADTLTAESITVSNNLNGITPSQLSYVDPTSSIQTQLNYLKTQTLSTNGGGTFMVYAELNGALNSSNSTCFQWSFGGGGVTSSSQPLGLYVGASCNLISLYLNFNTYPNSNVTIACLQNNSTIQTISVTTSQLTSNITGLSYSFNPGDYINFRTISGTGTVVGRICATFTTNGVVGPQGNIGLTPNISIGTVTDRLQLC